MRKLLCLLFGHRPLRLDCLRDFAMFTVYSAKTDAPLVRLEACARCRVVYVDWTSEESQTR